MILKAGDIVLKIGICDDQQKSIAQIERMVLKYFANRDIKADYSIEKFDDANKTLDYIIKNGGFDILLLDVYMPFVLGTELAKDIRKMGDKCRIIFLTTSKGHAIDAFAVRASDYILKPVKEDRLFSVLDELIQEIDEQATKNFAVKTPSGVVNVRMRDISYVELSERRMRVNLLDGTCVAGKVIRGTFEDEVEPLIGDENFVQCQKSYVVNMEQVLVMESENFKLRDGTWIPISKRYYKQTKTAYMKYLLREDY